MLIKKRGVDQTVDAEKMYLVNSRHQKYKYDKPDGVTLPVDPRKDVIAIAVTPQHENFDRRPDRNSREERAQEIIQVLRLEPENI